MKKNLTVLSLFFAVLLLCVCTASAADKAEVTTSETPVAETAQAEHVVASTATAGGEFDIETSNNPAFQILERVEIITYGAPQNGGLLPRLNKIETDIFGRSLPGSLTERQTAVLNFLEKGTASQPSLLFKLSVSEWAIMRKSSPNKSLVTRIETLESVTEGTVQNGAYAARIERLMVKVLPDGVTSTVIELPKTTVFRAALNKTLTVRNVRVNDKVVLRLVKDLIVDNVLVAPKGSRVFAHITKVKPPRGFGRASEIVMDFDDIEVLTPECLSVIMGEQAQKAMEADTGVIGAVGASFAGALLLGPVGLASGFLVRGNDKQLKEGTVFYLETEEGKNVSGYKIPEQISSIIKPDDDIQPQGSVPRNNQD